MSYAIDFSLKVLAALDRGESRASVAQRFELRNRTIHRPERRRDRDALAPHKTGPRSPTKLTLPTTVSHRRPECPSCVTVANNNGSVHGSHGLLIVAIVLEAV